MVVIKAGLAVDFSVPAALPEAVLLEKTHPLTPKPLIMMGPIPVTVQLLIDADVWVPLDAAAREISDPDVVMLPPGFSVWLPTMN